MLHSQEMVTSKKFIAIGRNKKVVQKGVWKRKNKTVFNLMGPQSLVFGSIRN